VGAVGEEGYYRQTNKINTLNDFSKVLPIAVHGDAIAGQGILYECKWHNRRLQNRWDNPYRN
jgi:2-oxoglutarate dehydrogenase complex dehydrogenase (E1) component-like enzyme